MPAATVPAAVLDVVHFATPGYGPNWPGDPPPPFTVTSLAPSSGPANTVVTFTGDSMTGQSVQAEFGGVMASPGGAWVIDNQHWRCQAPVHAPGLVSVRVWPGPITLTNAYTYT